MKLFANLKKCFTKAYIKQFIADNITHTKDSNARLAAAVTLGAFWGMSPLWGYHMALAVFTAHFLKLNKVLAFTGSYISFPPMIPVLFYFSIKWGGWIMGNDVDITFSGIAHQIQTEGFMKLFGEYTLLYCVGSIPFAATVSPIVFGITYALLTLFRKKSSEKEPNNLTQPQ